MHITSKISRKQLAGHASYCTCTILGQVLEGDFGKFTCSVADRRNHVNQEELYSQRRHLQMKENCDKRLITDCMYTRIG